MANPKTTPQRRTRPPRPEAATGAGGWFPFARGTAPAPPARRRTSLPRAGRAPQTTPKRSGWLGRPQASLPGRQTKPQPTAGFSRAVRDALAKTSAGQKQAGARSPAKPAMAGIAAGLGLVAAAVAKRRRDQTPNAGQTVEPVQPVGDGTTDEAPVVS